MFGIAAYNAELGETKPAVKLSISTVVQTCRFLVIQNDELPPPRNLASFLELSLVYTQSPLRKFMGVILIALVYGDTKARMPTS